jgi:hypothetical protein
LGFGLTEFTKEGESESRDCSCDCECDALWEPPQEADADRCAAAAAAAAADELTSADATLLLALLPLLRLLFTRFMMNGWIGIENGLLFACMYSVLVQLSLNEPLRCAYIT